MSKEGKEPLDSQDPKGWTGLRHASYALTKPYLHHHAKKVLAYDPAIEEGLTAAISAMDEVACFQRGRENIANGIEPKHLNRHLRDKLKQVGPEWTFETTVKDGVFYDHGDHVSAAIGGFDISRYDIPQNLVQLRNVCFGRRPRKDGDAHWAAAMEARPHWKVVAKGMAWEQYPAGKDYELAAKRPTLLGELQFGNWGLAYRDYLKVLSAHQERDIDLFVYLVPAGHLKQMLSDGIVTFDNAPRYLRQVAKAVNVPTAIFGIDVEVGAWKAPLDAATIKDMKRRVGRKEEDEDLGEDTAPIPVDR